MWSDAPIFLTYQDPYERFRIGDGAGSWNADPAKRKLLPGNQFPAEAYENYMRQSVPRWLSTDKAIVAAYLALVDKVCPCVMLLHSQGGTFGFQVAEQRPDKIKGIVAVEAAPPGNIANAPKLKDVPVLQIFGDYVDEHPRWATFKKIDMAYGEAIKAAGGTAGWINLPDIGIKGNSHMLMQDKNSDEIAEVINKWLVAKLLIDASLSSTPGISATRLSDRRARAQQRAHRPARHGLVPCRRPADRDFRRSPSGKFCSRRAAAGELDPNGPIMVEQMYAQYFWVRTAAENCRC